MAYVIQQKLVSVLAYIVRARTQHVAVAEAGHAPLMTLHVRIQKRFPAGALLNINDLQIPFAGTTPLITAVFGPSGAGKTTLLRCLAGLEHPDSGSIQFGNETWFDHGQSVSLAPQQRNIGFLSQDYALFPHLTVERNVAYGLRRSAPAERNSRVAELLNLLALSGFEQRYPRALSGGEQQRVALARAVAPRPRLLLLDEPLSALDAPTRKRLRGELRRLLLQLGIPALVVTHERLEALAIADHLVVLDAGAVLQSGPVQEIFSRPANLAVAGIVAMETVHPGRILESDGDLVTVSVGETKLTALRQDLCTRDVFVCIRGEDVILMKGADQPSSPRNHLPATIISITPEGPILRIALDCGFPLSAFLTRQAVEELALHPNDRVLALVKAPNVHLIPR